jgi:hypothetical protein
MTYGLSFDLGSITRKAVPPVMAVRSDNTCR